MNQRGQPLSSKPRTLFGVAGLILVLLLLAGALPGHAALAPSRPEAITNPQKAAILGGQSLLRNQQSFHFVYLPTLIR